MYSAEIDTYQWQTSNQIDGISNFTSRTDSTVVGRLPPYLDAPPGWRSQVIQSNSPLPPLHDHVHLRQTANYQSFHPTNVFHQNVAHASGTNYSFSNQETVLSEQQQRHIINQVESQNPPPILLRKTLPNNLVTYQQNVAVRYLQPPPLPPPGPLIIREVRAPQPPPLPPIQLTQRPPRPHTPPPLVLRERPPLPPPLTPAKVVEKLLPPPPPAPRRVIVEHFGQPPPKPADVIIERWLPYKAAGERRVLVQRAPPAVTSAQEPNLIVHYDSPEARIQRQFINRGVFPADPEAYLRQFGAEIDSHPINTQQVGLVQEASRAIPPPAMITDHASSSYIERTTRVVSPLPPPPLSAPYIPNTYEQTIRSVSPPSHSHDYCSSKYTYEPPVNYCNQSSSRYTYGPQVNYCDEPPSRYTYDPPVSYCNQSSSRYRYDGYPSSYSAMVDVTPSWNDYCRSSSFSSPSQTIHVHSENEFRDVMCELTNGRNPRLLTSY